MCPDGAEGTTYAILTTMSNVSMAAAQNLGTMFTGIWDVSNDTLWWVFRPFRPSVDNLRLFLLFVLDRRIPLYIIVQAPGPKERDPTVPYSSLGVRLSVCSILGSCASIATFRFPVLISYAPLPLFAFHA